MHLPGLLKLGLDPGHHPQGGNEGQARQHLSHSLAVHSETLDLPVAAADAALQVGRDQLAGHGLANVKHSCSVCL